MTSPKYSSRIIKVTALISDTRAFFEAWDFNKNVELNFLSAIENNVFGKVARARADDLLRTFRKRYFMNPEIGYALISLVKNNAPVKWIYPILYFFSANDDITLHDSVLQILKPRREAGFSDLPIEIVMRTLRNWSAEGKTVEPWNEKNIVNTAQHILATLRDYEILQGSKYKYFSPVYLPIEAFVFIVFFLYNKLGSGEKVLHSPEWGLFFMNPNDVEKYFIEAQQEHLLDFNAAGSVIRLHFPYKNYEELSVALIKRISS